MKEILDEYGGLIGLAVLVGALVYGFRLARRKDVKHASEMTGVAARLGLAPASEDTKTLEVLLDGMHCFSDGDNRIIKNLFSSRIDGMRYWICQVEGITSYAGEYGGGASIMARTLVIAESPEWNLPAVHVRPKHPLLKAAFDSKRVELKNQPLLEERFVIHAEDTLGARELLRGKLAACIANHADYELETRGPVLVCFPTAYGWKGAEAVATLFEMNRDCVRLIEARS